MRDAGHKLPGLLWMNVLSHVPEFARCLEKVTVADNFRFARVAGRQAVCVPARSTVFVQAVEGRIGQTAAFEPLTTGCGPSSRYERCRVRPLVHGGSC